MRWNSTQSPLATLQLKRGVSAEGVRLRETSATPYRTRHPGMDKQEVARE
jgi:hypothetical protein